MLRTFFNKLKQCASLNLNIGTSSDCDTFLLLFTEVSAWSLSKFLVSRVLTKAADQDSQ